MKRNIGKNDRILRLILSSIFFGLAFWLKSWLLAIIGLFTLYEALASWCVLYQFMGKNTCEIKDKRDQKD